MTFRQGKDSRISFFESILPITYAFQMYLFEMIHQIYISLYYRIFCFLVSLLRMFLRPPVRRIPKRPQQHWDMKMLSLLLLPHNKLDFHLRKKGLDISCAKVFFRVECEAVFLVPRFVKKCF
jgi:hypothetical protein